jgi:hypothetical protein
MRVRRCRANEGQEKRVDSYKNFHDNKGRTLGATVSKFIAFLAVPPECYVANNRLSEDFLASTRH